MVNLKTNYCGLELKNPIIVGASNLVNNLKNLKLIEEAGASAIVYKSLFEEQIHLENLEMDEQLTEYDNRHAEMINIFPNLEHAGPKYHLMQLEKAKKQINIPFIASLNAVYDLSWGDYAKDIASTGVDALELNFFSQITEPAKSGEDIISRQLKIVESVKKAVNIPVSLKLSPFYTNILQAIHRFDELEVAGFVLFNRFFEPSINIEDESHHFPWNLSSSNDKGLALRYAGLLYDQLNASVCSNTGIHSGADVIEMLLAGADAVQVVSTLYQNKIVYLSTMLADIEEWMAKKDYQSINDFKGKLSNKNVKEKYTYKRAQYVDILWNKDSLLNRYNPV